MVVAVQHFHGSIRGALRRTVTRKVAPWDLNPHERFAHVRFVNEPHDVAHDFGLAHGSREIAVQHLLYFFAYVFDVWRSVRASITRVAIRQTRLQFVFVFHGWCGGRMVVVCNRSIAQMVDPVYATPGLACGKIKPVRPEEITLRIPDLGFEAFNDLIAVHYDGKRAVIPRVEVESRIRSRLPEDVTFARWWLDVEPHYESAGWHVVFQDRAQWTSSMFVFTKK